MEWIVKPFDQLTPRELYGILELRCNVFVVEQDCPYPDLDRKDFASLHLFAREGEDTLACCRLIPPGISYEEASIGRVASALSHRRTGIGRELMRRAVEHLDGMGQSAIRISAQSYLRKFYGSFDFAVVSEEYLEDGIPHNQMFRAGR